MIAAESCFARNRAVRLARSFRSSVSSDAVASGASIEAPQTAPFVEQQQRRACLARLPATGRVV
jgi:hypothetical protein